MIKTRRKFRTVSLAAVAAAFGMVAVPLTPAYAQQCPEDSGRSQTLDPRVASALGTVFEQMTAEQYAEALAGLNQLIAQRGDRMKPFDRATTFELRGSVKASLEDYNGALRDFQTALDTNALPATRNNQLRYFIAQLYFQEENYQRAIAGLNTWVQTARACGEEVDPNAYYLLAAAYTQITPPNYRAAVGPAENAVAGAPEPRKGYYDILNLIYSELGDNGKRIPLLERMVNFWPSNKGYWTQLSGAYSTTGRDRDAFSVLEVAYRAGLLTTESELMTLVQYYSYFENPYRGAKMLSREMDAGNIERTQDNLVTLSQLWSQSREHERSIPILREAAGRSNDGELYYRLGQVLLADEQYAQAERALRNALRLGGMDRDDTGDAYMLLGTAIFSQAGPSDVAIWDRAIDAFENARRYQNSAPQAAQWLSYVRAVKSTYIEGVRIEQEQIRQACLDDLARFETQRRIVELRGGTLSDEQLEEEQRLNALCGPESQTTSDDAAAGDDAGGDAGGEE